MSIFIKGLNFPSAYSVKVIINPTGEAFVDYGPYFETREAVDVPAPHGRLIDADKLPVVDFFDNENWHTIIHKESIDAAPTIIEAEENV